MGIHRLFHPAVFHLFTIIVVLFTFAGWFADDCYSHDCRMVDTPLNSLVKSSHMFRKETLADQLERMYLFVSVCHQFRFAECDGRTILKREGAILRSYRRLAFCYRGEAYLGMSGNGVELVTLECAVKIPNIVFLAGQ